MVDARLVTCYCQVRISKGVTRNLIIVATEFNSVFAFDTGMCTLYWLPLVCLNTAGSQHMRVHDCRVHFSTACMLGPHLPLSIRPCHLE